VVVWLAEWSCGFGEEEKVDIVRLDTAQNIEEEEGHGRCHGVARRVDVRRCGHRVEAEGVRVAEGDNLTREEAVAEQER
jgi:hypothetical protein